MSRYSVKSNAIGNLTQRILLLLNINLNSFFKVLGYRKVVIPSGCIHLALSKLPECKRLD
ncbi:hypothetical protein METHP14_10297 [Pseudomonas sp. P14-2025]